MPAVYIDFGECFAQPIPVSFALLVSWHAWLRPVDPIQDPKPRMGDQVIQAIKRAKEEALSEHILVLV